MAIRKEPFAQERREHRVPHLMAQLTLISGLLPVVRLVVIHVVILQSHWLHINGGDLSKGFEQLVQSFAHFSTHLIQLLYAAGDGWLERQSPFHTKDRRPPHLRGSGRKGGPPAATKGEWLLADIEVVLQF